MSEPGKPQRRASLWTRAADAAARTPPHRNRYVDFLRALSILAVISGHWLVAAPFVDEGGLSLGNMLEHRTWTRWLTWGFQVMPVFFLVGGYSNGVSWEGAKRDGRGYAEWLSTRLQRLLGPVIPLLLAWMALGVTANAMGIDPQIIRTGSQIALIPVWFLSVYVLAVLLVPATHSAWKRIRLKSFWVLALAVVADDFLFFAADLRAVGWLNYGFIWLAVHQLGYAWRDGRLTGPRQTIPWAVGGILLLAAVVTFGPYPVSMVSVPGDEVSNSLPPKLPMLLLGVWQCGLVLTLERPMRRWLERAGPWTATVLVNGMIMTIYLWHLTASTLVIGLALLLGGVGLTEVPGSGAWWAMRPLWLTVYLLALAPLALAFGRFERAAGDGPPPAAWRLVVGAALTCTGLALLALHGIGADALRITALTLPFAGALLAGTLPTPVNQ